MGDYSLSSTDAGTGFALLAVEVEFASEFRLIEFKTQQNDFQVLPKRNIVSSLSLEMQKMQKQLLLLAACIAVTLAMSSVGQAQSYFIGNETYQQVVWGEQVMSRPASVMPVGVRVDRKPEYTFTPAPPIPSSGIKEAKPLVLPAIPVLVASPETHVLPPVQHAMPPIQYSPVQHVMPITAIQQPVCLSGG